MSVKNELLEWLKDIKVIESHEHYVGETKPISNVINFIVSNYYYSDMYSAAFEFSDEEIDIIGQYDETDINGLKEKHSFDERYEAFEKLYNKSKYTAYARGMELGLKECWGIEEINYETLKDLEERMKERDVDFYNNLIDKHNIVATICDVGSDSVLNNEKGEIASHCRFVVGIPSFHNLHSRDQIDSNAKRFGKSNITSLDDYIEAMEFHIKKCIEYGFVGLKDQSAYGRDIAYKYPTKAQAEKIFNKIMFDARYTASEEDARPLDDFLFHQLMRMAKKYDLPVQIHTGHMAGVWNEIEKTNAVHLSPLLELYKDVRFDLFHGNWPYMDEYLFLGKNYQNVTLDMCWVQSIDPIYSIELMRRIVQTVPHTKLLVHGGDTGAIEWQIGYLLLAKANVSAALGSLVDEGWINIKDAKQIALDWFFNNPNEVFKLGFDKITI